MNERSRVEFPTREDSIRELGEKMWDVIQDLPSSTTIWSLLAWHDFGSDLAQWGELDDSLRGDDHSIFMRLMYYLVRSDSSLTLARMLTLDIDELASNQKGLGIKGKTLFRIGFQGEGVEE